MDQEPAWGVPGRAPAGSPAPLGPSQGPEGTAPAAGLPPEPADLAGIVAALEEHLAVCAQLLALAQKESEALQSAAAFPAAETRAERKALLNRLESALNGVIHRRILWEAPGTSPIGREPQLARLVPACLDMIMRLLVLDRENEELLLRRGLLPARALPAAEQARPHFVAGLYQKHGQPPA